MSSAVLSVVYVKMQEYGEAIVNCYWMLQVYLQSYPITTHIRHKSALASSSNIPKTNRGLVTTNPLQVLGTGVEPVRALLPTGF